MIHRKLHDGRTERSEIVGRDLTPLDNVSSDEAQWLRALAVETDSNRLTLGLGPRQDRDRSPVVWWNWEDGRWWAGRFVGEVTYAGRTLRIEPRFGAPALERWLCRIWGIRLVQGSGLYTAARAWLWSLLARIWANRLLLAAKHGPPLVRVEQRYVGASLRGRLNIPHTAQLRRAGRSVLSSRTRNRRTDPVVGGILLGAFDRLRDELGHLGDERFWLTDRGWDLLKTLRGTVSQSEIVDACEHRGPVRYAPITESYRAIVELSRSILASRPMTSSATGSRNVVGALIDMAEVWELYVYHLLRALLPTAQVTHTGRDDPAGWLLQGQRPGDNLAALKPDVLVRRGSACLIVDAKYKLTTPSPERPQGLLREDLYQIVAYLSASWTNSGPTHGFLVYPDSAQSNALQGRSPFNLMRTASQLTFIGLEGCGEGSAGQAPFNASEARFHQAVLDALK